MWLTRFLSRLRHMRFAKAHAASLGMPKGASEDRVAPMSDRQLAVEIRHLGGLRLKMTTPAERRNERTT
jgi:hypothetical protein